MSAPIAIALSGGVDSLVSAALLLEEGHEVVGVHFLTGFEIDARPPLVDKPSLGATFPAGSASIEKIGAIAAALHIPLKIIDLREQFQKEVVDYFVRAYQAGRTPNPCLVCNRAIKFGILFEKARQMGAGLMATGHYARIREGPDGRRRLLRGVDPLKDQAYFLARLSGKQLQNVVLPLGDYTKEETRRMAASRGLRPPVSRESQDICFIKDGAYGQFLQSQPDFVASPGPIQTLRGEVIGSHKGLHLFTVGQRRGINCPAALPYYVVRMDAAENRLIVGFKEDLLADQCQVDEINWIGEPPRRALEIEIKLRYRHPATEARLIPVGEVGARVEFARPQTAVTPGQGAVFYQGAEVLGGGWIR